jgi:hypothetical protein
MSVPWLVWQGGPSLKCLRCGAVIPIRFGIPVADLLVYLDAVRAEHADCEAPPPSTTGP